ncbi:nitrilase-related carbon-nitrogen hydrolase [Ornithobacterium rhinotracheale]|uniref:nitrilase-related carbon-nitrogen hydrolase n=1 Tax=Ornithobacterium rhinotracheale TaxID=28251 RepID=UPI004036C962
MKEELIIATLALDIVWENPEENFKQIDKIIRNVNADIFILPEMFSYGFSMNTHEIAEDAYGKSFKFLQQKAIQKQAVFCASIPVKGREGYYNRLYWVAQNETFVRYDKRHLFSYAGENKHYTAGNKQVIINYEGWRILPQICYDLRFPVFSRNTPFELYDLAIYVTNWPSSRSFAWNTLLHARAIENMAYVVGVNRSGEDPNGLSYLGDCHVIDPLGKDIQALDKKESLSIFSINKPYLIEQRQHFSFLNDADDFTIQF